MLQVILLATKKAFNKIVEEKLHIWFTVVQVTAAETDFQWLLVNLKTQIPQGASLPLCFCHLSFGILEEMEQVPEPGGLY